MKASTLRKLRQVHNYTGVFFAPAILFFAFTGALQTIGLHEAHGGAPPPPRWIAAIASLHKHQVIAAPRPRPAPGAALRHVDADEHEDHDHDRAGGRAGGQAGGFNLLKPFVLLLSVALFATTALGLTIALTTRSSRRLSWILTIAGVLVPVALVLA